MPKVMVVFVGDDTLADAEAVATGAKSVRFTEVDVRAAQATTSRHRVLDRARDGVGTPPDAIVFVANESSSGDLSALRALVSENTVLASVGARGLAFEAASRGGIVVTLAAGDSPAVGARVAKVAGWVRHALGHEAEARGAHATDSGDGSSAHSHTHGHEHSHADGHSHDHGLDHGHRH